MGWHLLHLSQQMPAIQSGQLNRPKRYYWALPRTPR